MSEEMTTTENISTEQESSADPVIRRKKIKSAYGWAGGGMLIQVVIATLAVMIVAAVYSPFFMKGYFADKDMNTITQGDIMAASLAMTTDGTYLLISNIVGYVVANISAFFICVMALGAFKARSLFKKPSFGAADMVLAAASIMCVQGVSLIVQLTVMSITGMTGMPESVSASLTLDDNVLRSLGVLTYAVILGPITEELLFRGFILNALSPVSRKFAIVMSAVLFGLFHGNFNQMFNGILLGLVFGYVAVKSGSVITSIIVHMFANGNIMLMEIVCGDGENADKIMIAYVSAMMVIGIAAMVMMLRRKGMIAPTDTIASEFTYEIEEDEVSKLKMKTLAKCPTFWIAAVYYLGTAVIMAISANA